MKSVRLKTFFKQEINQRRSCTKKLSKYAASFVYKNTILIVLSARSGELCIISSVSVVGAPV